MSDGAVPFYDDDEDTMPLPEVSPSKPNVVVVDLTIESGMEPVITAGQVGPDDYKYRKVFPTKLKLWKCSRYWFKECATARKKISRFVRQLEEMKKETSSGLNHQLVSACSVCCAQSTLQPNNNLIKKENVSDLIIEPDDAWYEEKLRQADQIALVLQVIVIYWPKPLCILFLNYFNETILKLGQRRRDDSQIECHQ